MKIAVAGCAGRMGQMLVNQILATPGCELAGGTEWVESPQIGADVAQLAGAEPSGLLVSADSAAVFTAADAVIDFTLPQATAGNAQAAAAAGCALVVGTTGLDDEQTAALDAAAEKIAIVQDGNMSLGVNLLLGLTRQVAAALGADYDIEVLEMHHKHKVDAPSGTALMLGRAAAEGRGVDLEDVSQRVRDGHTGARKAGDIGFATLRGGSVIGDHTVIFAGEEERIEIGHRAVTRAVFAKGAVQAAMWTAGQAPGRYSVRDVLGLSG